MNGPCLSSMLMLDEKYHIRKKNLSDTKKEDGLRHKIQSKLSIHSCFNTSMQDKTVT